MKRKQFTFLGLISTIVIALCMGLSGTAVAQKGGKGGEHGNGHGNGGGNGHGNGGGSAGKDERRAEGQQGGWQLQRQAPQVYRPQIQIQQPQYEVRQQKQAWKQERKQQEFERRAWQRSDVQANLPQRRQGPPPWAGVWTAPGQIRKRERQFAKEEIKAEPRSANDRADVRPPWRAPERVLRYSPTYRSNRPYSEETFVYPRTRRYASGYSADRYEAVPELTYSPNYFRDNYLPPVARNNSAAQNAPRPVIGGGTYYPPEPQNSQLGGLFGGSNWTEMLLGTVLEAFLGGRLNGREFAARPSYDSDYGSFVPRDRYESGEPMIEYGMNQYSGQRVIFSSPENIYDQGYDDELTRRAFNSGYEQGFLAGQAASNRGYDNAEYENPYFFDDAGYGYGAYSISLNRERRLLSEAYDRGYRDALGRNYAYDADNGGDVDLVSLMLSSALGMFDI